MTFEDEMVAALPRVRSLARTLCRDRSRADDLVQDTMLRALESRADYVGAGMAAWLCVICWRGFYSERRKTQRRAKIAYALPRELAPDDPHIALEFRQTVEALQRLPPEIRFAVVLVAVDGLQLGQAAARCGCSLATIKNRLRRARAFLNPNHGRQP